ncbi:putative quorum-sensing-regulated virulence factor [Dysgonomonas sp. HGC4]|uniref:putative quorum-sensing-regulated virulence factor n=1 Tax=Dysgonomonas sp. HGC4 TaxID=1658009 RepID=UPI0012FA1B59|nr:DUF3820 family protein [Dysgonomonas sp. HGC4]MBD8349381.1 DUF3820 family protein [Dysgonomonas sp. HGC4]
MPYGIYQGDKMLDVPGSHLLWLYEEGECDTEVKEYIEDNMDAIKLEIKNEKATKGD